MKKKCFLVAFCIPFFISCMNNEADKVEKYQNRRNNIIVVKDKIIDIETNILFGNCYLDIIDDILVVNETQPSGEKGIHLLNKNTFKYITSTGIIGKGPGEITRQGRLGIDHKNKVLWVPDNGKNVIWKFYLDSILNNKFYKPTELLKLNYDLFMSKYGILNDSIALGKAVTILPNKSFEMAMAKLNLNKNLTEKFGYEHPKAVGKKTSSVFKLSPENNLYVNCYYFCDLITICDLNGNLRYNIFGPEWLKSNEKKNKYYSGVDIINNYIIAAYLGDVGIVYDEYERQQSNLPTKFLVFDLKGNYVKTIETGYKITNFCADKENNRIIAYFDNRINPLGYFNLDFD